MRMYILSIITYDIIISVSGYEESCEMRIFVRCTWARLYQPHQSNKGKYFKTYLYFKLLENVINDFDVLLVKYNLKMYLFKSKLVCF